jgi:glycosyltransferase involved in cell wall biosynthesis
MNSSLFCLNPSYSTTRQFTRQKPVFEKNIDDKFESKQFLPAGKGRQGEGGIRTQGYFKTSLPDQPLITIVTVVFNGAKNLEETIHSVINQKYSNVEFLIIDGGSTDGTLEIIRKYEHAIDYWISEKDKGIYDAMNKGLALAGGEWINFINAGDILNVNCIIKSHIEIKDRRLIIFSFKEYYRDKLGKSKYRIVQAKYKKYDLPTSHNAIIFPKCNSIKYNTVYDISADYDYFLQYINAGFKTVFYDSVYMKYLIGGVSERMVLKVLKEKYIINKKYYHRNLEYWIYVISLLIKVMTAQAIKFLLPKKMLLYIKNQRGFFCE